MSSHQGHPAHPLLSPAKGRGTGARSHCRSWCHRCQTAHHRCQTAHHWCQHPRQLEPYHAHPLVLQVPQHRGELLQRLGWKGHTPTVSISQCFVFRLNGDFLFVSGGTGCLGFFCHPCSLFRTPSSCLQKQPAAERPQHHVPTSPRTPQPAPHQPRLSAGRA